MTTAPDFWQRLADRRAQAAGYADAASAPTLETAAPEDPHVRHRKMTTREMSGACEQCFEDRMDWMSKQPRAGHIGRTYLRLCHVYEREP